MGVAVTTREGSDFRIAGGADILEVLESLRSNTIHNYIAPGLDSHLIAREGGSIRMFHMTRDQQFYISPHSHRFNFASVVICGWARQHLYRNLSTQNVGPQHTGADDRLYAVREYVPDRANPTNYGIKTASYGHFLRTTTVYEAGQWYSMKYDEFHSIEFSKGARVLFIEGPKIKDTSYFLEPVVNGKVVPLFDVPTWMYKP